VLTNPPFGKKSSLPSSAEVKEAGRNGRLPTRKDFWANTANKQLNFLQHVTGMLSLGGRAALVIPDNVLFERGVGEIIRRRLLESFNVHTLMRLPTGLFYAQGVKANVIFFDRPPKAQKLATKRLWVYDLRTDMHFTLKTKRMRRTDLEEFIQCYGDGSDSSRKETWTRHCPNGRWRAYTYKEIDRRAECNLDLTWITPAASVRAQHIPTADSLAQSITTDLRTALSEIEKLSASL
jgi:type I restriction enzyme M protein